MPAPLVVMVTGAGPGLGKSTLAARVHAHLSATEPRAELFREEDIPTNPCFTEVSATFRGSGQVRVVQLPLTGDITAGLARAAAREGAGWLERFIARTEAYPARDAGLVGVEGAVDYLVRSAPREVALLGTTPWPVVEVDADAGADAACAAAVAEITRRRPLRQVHGQRSW